MVQLHSTKIRFLILHTSEVIMNLFWSMYTFVCATKNKNKKVKDKKKIITTNEQTQKEISKVEKKEEVY